MSGSADHRSLLGSTLGSFKDKISRKSSTRSNRSGNGTPSPSPSPSPSPRPSSNPFSNPSPATRRPREEPPPPSYNEAVSSPTATAPGAGAPARRSAVVSSASLSTAEDPYAFLSAFDTVFLIDDSGSMAGRSWRETQAAIRAIAPICASHDADGLDVYFLNALNPRPEPSSPRGAGFPHLRTASAVEGVFSSVRPWGGTPTGTRIQAILGPYVTAFERAVISKNGDADSTGIKPVNIIVITDGVPTDDPESVLLGLAKRLDRVNAPPFQVGVQFFQVGREQGAREALQELDDCLGGEAASGSVRDMVDTTTWDGAEGSENVLTAEGILKAVLGGVVKRLDRRPVNAEAPRRR